MRPKFTALSQKAAHPAVAADIPVVVIPAAGTLPAAAHITAAADTVSDPLAVLMQIFFLSREASPDMAL